MPLFTVMRRGEEPVTIEAENWIVAMGTGIAQLGGDVAIDRLACEMLTNGTVIARDVRTGPGYVILPSKGAEVKPKTEDAEVPMEAPEVDTFDELLDEANESDPSLDDTIDFSLEEQELERVLDAVRSTRSAMDAWEMTLRTATDLIEVDAATAVEATPNAGLIFASVQGPLQHKLRAMTLPYGTGFMGFSIDRCSALVVHDVTNDERHYSGVDNVTGFRTRSVMVVPIHNEKQVFGCLQLLNPLQRFTRRDLELLETLAATLSDRLALAGVRGRRRG